MTIRDWITSRLPDAPRALLEQMIAALGRDADAVVSRTPELCIAAAARVLDALLSDNRFARENARELLAIDALTTLAFEYASDTSGAEEQLASLAAHAVATLSQLTTQRV